MADELQILAGFYKDVPVSINSGSIEGGLKAAVKQFPGRDTQSVEILGLQPRKYSLEIIISEKTDQSYFDYRGKLLAALEDKSPGVLIHPMYGRIESVVAVSYSLNESFSSFGDSSISVNFEVDNSTGIPVSFGNSISEIADANESLLSAINDDIAGNFSVTEQFIGNFSDAVSKVEGVIDSAIDSTSFIGVAADTLNEFNALVGGLSASVNSLVSEPTELADSIIGMFESVNGLYSSPSATLDTFKGFFEFGDDDDVSINNTAGRIEKNANNATMNGAVASAALGYSYLAAVGIDFETASEIDEIAVDLDAQYDAVINSGAAQEVKDSATDMRVKVIDAFDDARVKASQVITVHTSPTTARILAFNYYGNDERGQDIVALNDFSDVSFVEGDVQVFTE